MQNKQCFNLKKHTRIFEKNQIAYIETDILTLGLIAEERYAAYKIANKQKELNL